MFRFEQVRVKVRVAATATMVGLSSFTAGARAQEVSIAPIQSFTIAEHQAHVGPGGLWWVLVPSLGQIEATRVSVSVSGGPVADLGVYACFTDDDLERFKAGAPSYCRGGRGQGQFSIDVGPAPGAFQLVLDNRQGLLFNKSASVQVDVQSRLPQGLVDELRSGFGNMLAELVETFDVTPFDIEIRPCGTMNAYSGAGGRITLCSEYLFTAMAAQETGMVMGVLFHELGHSLLRLWGEPGWDNEAMVDEFASVMLISLGRPDLVKSWHETMARRFGDGMSGALSGGPHPLTVQRATAAQRVLAAPQETVRRWQTLLYRHMRQAALEDIRDGRRRDGLSDARLAREELERRSGR